MPKYEQILFQWLEQVHEGGEARGTVVIRGDKNPEMVLEINDTIEVEGPYLIVGRMSKGAAFSYFSGQNSAREKTNNVKASWAEIGDGVYAGRWIEEREEYFFTFRLPTKR
jgi:hypothetical protein